MAQQYSVPSGGSVTIPDMRNKRLYVWADIGASGSATVRGADGVYLDTRIILPGGEVYFPTITVPASAEIVAVGGTVNYSFDPPPRTGDDPSSIDSIARGLAVRARSDSTAQRRDNRWCGFGQRGVGFTGDAGTDPTNNSFNNWSRHFIPTGRKLRAIKVAWSRCDINTDGEADRAQDITSFAASLVINNTVHRLFFGGAASTTITAGRGVLLSDPLWVDSGTATDFVVRAYGAWTGTLKLAATPDSTVLLTNEACNRGTGLSNRTMDAYDAATPSNSGSGLFCPVAVYGLFDDVTPVVGLDTDSIGKGTNDTSPTATYGWKGYIQKSLGNALPWVYTGRGGHRLWYLATRDDGERSVLMEGGITHLILAMVTNDVWIGRTKAEILADIQTVCARYWDYGVKTYIVTCPPRTTGTYTSAAGQTLYDAVKEPVRLDYNADVRANWSAYGHSGLIDMAAVLEDPAAPGKWVSSGAVARTTDGVHPNTSGVNNLVSAAIVTPAMFTL
ncbi:SGNH/GDSL hydrolase family protein [Xanthobacter autotrophicus]|uniref:SGNH/GDSL hydrolase family protein n=1 Tax=Xanthobacter autotrophicus TaxID=280 RepID=UPI0037278F99